MIEFKGGDWMEETVVTGMATSLDDIQITVVNLPASTGNLYRLFGQLAERGVNVDMISHMITLDGRMYVSFTIPKEDISIAEEILIQWQGEHKTIKWEINKNIAKISVVGLGMRTHSGVAAKVFKIMTENNIDIKMVTTSEIKISWVVDDHLEEKVVTLMGKAFGMVIEE